MNQRTRAKSVRPPPPVRRQDCIDPLKPERRDISESFKNDKIILISAFILFLSIAIATGCLIIWKSLC